MRSSANNPFYNIQDALVPDDILAGTGISVSIFDGQVTISATGGDSLSGTANEIAYFDTTTSIASLTTATYPSLTEISYVKGVTSAIQTQLSAKAVSATLAATTTGNGASLIGIEDSGGLITATTVEGALAENRTAIDAIEAAGYITDLSSFDTDDLSEGATNLYFTNARALSATGISGLTTNYLPFYDGSGLDDTELYRPAAGKLSINSTSEAGVLNIGHSGDADYYLNLSGAASIPTGSSYQAIRAVPNLTITGDVTNVYGLNNNIGLGGTSTYAIGSISSNYARLTITGSASPAITDVVGYQAQGILNSSSGSPSFTNYYAFKAANETDATNHYGFYSEMTTGRWSFYGASTGESYFGGETYLMDNVGINTQSPSYALDVRASAGTAVRISNSGGLSGNTPSATHGELVIDSGDANIGIEILGSTTSNQRLIFSDSTTARGSLQYDHTGDYMALSTAGGERLRIDSSGNVGIGTTTPGAYKLYVNGDAYASGNVVLGTSSSNTATINGRLIGGLGAIATTGTLDWNDSSNSTSGQGYTLLQGTATNGPAVSGYFHPFNFEYTQRNGTGNTTQLAIPYGLSSSIDAGIYMRGRYSGTWGNWVKIISENTSGNVGIGTTSPSEKLGVNGNIEILNGGYIKGSTYASSKLTISNDVTLSSNQHLIFSPGGASEKARITSAGNLGIGITSPAYKLDILGSGDTITGGSIRARNLDDTTNAAAVIAVASGSTDAASGYLGAFHGSYAVAALQNRVALVPNSDATGVSLYAGASQDIRLLTSGLERMRVDASGNVGIGTTTANEILTVEGVLSLDETSAPSATTGYGKVYVKSSDSGLYFMDGTGTEYDLLASGGASALNDLSDVTLTTPGTGDFLRHNGTVFVNTTLSAGDIPDLSATYQPLDADLTAIAALSSADSNFIVGSASGWVVESGATARTSLGLGTIATQSAASVAITGGSITGITDLALADGGTGASLSDPNADRIMFWDDSAGAVTWLTASTGLSISGTNITVRAASTSQTGIAEASIASEVNSGSDATRYVSPDSLAGSYAGIKTVSLQVTDGSGAIATGDGQAYLRIPTSVNGMNLVDVSISLSAPSTSGTPTVMIARGRQSSATSAHTFVDMLSTAVTIDANEYDSKDATTAAVINTSNDDVATGDLIRVDVDGVGSGPTAVLIVTLQFQLP